MSPCPCSPLSACSSPPPSDTTCLPPRGPYTGSSLCMGALPPDAGGLGPLSSVPSSSGVINTTSQRLPMVPASETAASPPLLCPSVSPTAISHVMHFCSVLPLTVYLSPGMQALPRAGILSVLSPVGSLASSPGPVTQTLSFYRCAACGEHWLFMNRHRPRSSEPMAAPGLLEATAQQEKGRSGGHDSPGQGG